MGLPQHVNAGHRFAWWAPWVTTRPWRLWLWTGTNEWCQRSLCLDLPFLGTFIVFWERTLRTMPCAECWDVMDAEQRADYAPGGDLPRRPGKRSKRGGPVSRSDNTDPRQQRDRWMRLGWNSWPLPRRTGGRLRREWQKTQRQKERAALRRGDEPEPARPRHSVHWNWW